MTAAIVPGRGWGTGSGRRRRARTAADDGSISSRRPGCAPGLNLSQPRMRCSSSERQLGFDRAMDAICHRPAIRLMLTSGVSDRIQDVKTIEEHYQRWRRNLADAI